MHKINHAGKLLCVNYVVMQTSQTVHRYSQQSFSQLQADGEIYYSVTYRNGTVKLHFFLFLTGDPNNLEVVAQISYLHKSRLNASV